MTYQKIRMLFGLLSWRPCKLFVIYFGDTGKIFISTVGLRKVKGENKWHFVLFFICCVWGIQSSSLLPTFGRIEIHELN